MGDIDVNVLRTLDYNQPPASQQTSLFVDTADSKSIPQRKMQDAALFEKATSKQLAGSQMFTSPNGNSNEKVCNSSSVMEMRRSVPDENAESLKNTVPSSSHHMVEFAISSQSQPPSTSSQSTWSPMSSSSGNVNYSDNILIQRQNSNNNSLNFQQFPPFSSDYNAGISSNPLSQTSLSSQQSQSKGGRPITGHSSNMAGYHQLQQNLHVTTTNTPQMVTSWNNMQPQSWANSQSQCQASLYPPWNAQQRRSVPNMSAVPPMSVRKPAVPLQTTSFVAPSKFRRSTSFPGQIQQAAVGPKPSYEIPAFDDVTSYQQMGTPYDSMKFPSLENQLFDIMKNNCVEGVQMHGDNVKVSGKMPFVIEDPLTEDSTLEQSLPNISGTPGSSPSSHGIDRIERFSRKVFVGGLPPDIDEEEITTAFRRFGALVVDWPHKAESKSYFPPKGYCFLIFQDELSVQSLIEACLMDDDKLYWCVSSPTMKDKPVQIRPWSLSDSDFVMDGSQPLDPRKTIFVGGVPRPLRAVELAMIMDRLYGGVCYAGIDTDPELKYPKGAGRVAFSNQQSYIAAISARFVQLLHGDIDKRVEVKPYVLDDQMCDECHGARCAGKFAPFFCANVTCLQYYCEYCWAQIHSRPGREYHKPLVKEGADRPRAVPFRWCENKLDVYKW